MSRTHVLVVDDDPRMLRALELGLGQAGYEVATARTGASGLERVGEMRPHVALIDLRLPDIGGIDLVRRLRAWTSMPLIVISGEASVAARVTALNAGADDFIVKPFALAELNARIRAALRRFDQALVETPVLHTGELTIDLMARTVQNGRGPTRLSPIKWRILEQLVTNPGRTLSHERIITSVWGPTHGDEMRPALRVHIQQLRAAIGDDVEEPRYILTEPSAGYRWIAPTS